MKSKEAQLGRNVRNIFSDSANDLRETCFWYSPHSPFVEQPETKDFQYRHIYFPTKI